MAITAEVAEPQREPFLLFVSAKTAFSAVVISCSDGEKTSCTTIKVRN